MAGARKCPMQIKVMCCEQGGARARFYVQCLLLCWGGAQRGTAAAAGGVARAGSARLLPTLVLHCRK